MGEDKIMALIKCPECGKEIDSVLNTCPECGYFLGKGILDNNERLANILSLFRTVLILMTMICFIVSGIFFYKGYDVKNEYYNSDYSILNKNAYVGGDAYNYIINGTYFTGYSVIASAFFLSGIVLIVKLMALTIKLEEIRKEWRRNKSNEDQTATPHLTKRVIFCIAFGVVVLFLLVVIKVYVKNLSINISDSVTIDEEELVESDYSSIKFGQSYQNIKKDYGDEIEESVLNKNVLNISFENFQGMYGISASVKLSFDNNELLNKAVLTITNEQSTKSDEEIFSMVVRELVNRYGKCKDVQYGHSWEIDGLKIEVKHYPGTPHDVIMTYSTNKN